MKGELLERKCWEQELRKEKEITLVQYLYSKSYWSLWMYWSPVCVTRETFFFPVLKAQQRQNPPSHQSSKHSDPATTHTKSCEQFAFILQVWEGPFYSQDTQSYPEPAVWILGQTDLSHVQWQWRRINLPIGSVYRLITPPRCDIWRPCMTFLCI